MTGSGSVVSVHKNSNTFYFILKWANPGLFFVYFWSLQTNITIYRTIIFKKCTHSIRSRDLNPLPLERESLPITTRPGLPPWNRNRIVVSSLCRATHFLDWSCPIVLNWRPALQWHFLLRWVFSGPGNKKPRTLKVKLGTSHKVIIPPTLSVLWLDYGGLRWPLLSSIGLEWPRTFTYWDPSCRPQKYLRRHPRPERQQGWSGPTPPRPRWKISQTSINGCPQAKRTGQQTE